MRVWGKILKNHRTVGQMTVPVGKPENDQALLLAVKDAVDEMVLEMDLPRPIWFRQNEDDLLKFGRTQFHQDHFIEPVSYRTFELELIDEEDG